MQPLYTTVDTEIFANSDIFVVKISRLGHDLPRSVNNSVISRAFYFHETSHSSRIYSKTKIESINVVSMQKL